MPGFWRVTSVYGLAAILSEALLLLASGITFRSGTGVFYAICLILSLLCPALVAGLGFGRHSGRAPVSSEAWRFGGWFAALQGALTGLLVLFIAQDFLAEEPDGAVILAVIVVVYTLAALLISRYAFPFGARQAVRARGRR
ncbi:hypothetical protein LX70_00130 [Defluviimonas denitrificans]|uniref:Uncharacterized protein n=1 Tax=Albidovulum denitrificans TaxID=404881 RepID=A0A2S8SC31_9RHOB|nr:hypothetical protein LX70_00130 [Defluviimonas denitrificans]